MKYEEQHHSFNIKGVVNFIKWIMTDPRARVHWAFRLLLPAAVALMLVANWDILGRYETFRVGEVSPRTYFSLVDIVTYDNAELLENQKWISDKITDVVVKKQDSSAVIARRLDMLTSMPTHDFLPQALQKLLVSYDAKKRSQTLGAAAKLGNEALISNGTADSEVLWELVTKLEITQAEKNVIYQILLAVFSDTSDSDDNITRLARQTVAASVTPMMREIPKNRVIVYKGETITEPIARVLRAEGFRDNQFPWRYFLFTVMGVFLWSFWPTWIESREGKGYSKKEWVFIGAVLLLCWAIQLPLSTKHISPLAIMAMGAWFFLAFPPANAFHLTLGGGVMGGIISFASSPSMMTLEIIMSMVAGGFGYLFFHNLGTRIKLIQNLLIYGITLIVSALFFRWGVGVYTNYTNLLTYVAMCFVWVCVVPAFLPVWEMLFDIVSPLRLMEMSNPSSLLLKRLQVEAPGTYHHVLTVGTLAEAAAERLGLNGLLVRAGAYYHDIGKLRRPKYFVENQSAGENVHDNLAPSISALVIISHVRDGLEIAEEHGIPKALQAFIAEHHGTTCLTYFYKKARNNGDMLPMEQFCYPGPRPRSKETGIVMLADSVEAAAKAAPGRLDVLDDLKELVAQVITSKVSAHQIEYVDFTIKELAIIQDTFCSLLRSMHHTRKVKPIAAKEGEERERHERSGSKIPVTLTPSIDSILGQDRR